MFDRLYLKVIFESRDPVLHTLTWKGKSWSKTAYLFDEISTYENGNHPYLVSFGTKNLQNAFVPGLMVVIFTRSPVGGVSISQYEEHVYSCDNNSQENPIEVYVFDGGGKNWCMPAKDYFISL